jgi:hypothetical protein
MPKPIAPPSEPGDYFVRFKDVKFSQRIWPCEVVWFGGQVHPENEALVVRIGVAIYPIEDFDFYDVDR